MSTAYRNILVYVNVMPASEITPTFEDGSTKLWII